MEEDRGIHPLTWALPGFLLQSYGVLTGSRWLGLVGSALLVAGLAKYIQTKGYHPGWGLWGLVPLVGPLVLIIQRPYYGLARDGALDDVILEEDPHIRSFSHRRRLRIMGGAPLLAVAAPLGFLLIMASPHLPHATVTFQSPQALSSTFTEHPMPDAMDTDAAPAAKLVARPEESAEPQKKAAAPRDEGTPDKPPEEERPAPASAQEPAAPPEEQEAATDVAQPAPEPAQPTFEGRYGRIKQGMTYEEVLALAGDDTTLISGEQEGNKLVHWRGPEGATFTARFRDGALDRKTPLQQPLGRSELERLAGDIFQLEVEEPEGAPESPPTEDVAGAPAEAGPEPPPGEVAARPLPAGEPPLTQPEALAPAVEPEETPEPEDPAPTQSRVVRISGDEAPRGRTSYKKARLPRFTRPIEKGPHDVHIFNPTYSSVKVGVRSGKRGKNLTIGAYGEATVYVNNGNYSLYFLEAEDPEELQSAGNFAVNSPPTAIRLSLR